MILIGTSGYSYEGWKGLFYPRGTKSADQLQYYARRFSVVELNTTYYGMPTAERLGKMVERVPPGFEFTVKAHQDLTHSGQFLPASFTQFREGVQPLVEAGMLGCILAQFPFGFRRNPQNEDYLARFREHLPELPVVVEFRNSEWVSDAVFEHLHELDLGFCCVDEPPLPGLMPGVVRATSDVGYVRFHGRNAEAWYKHQNASERYNYLYSRDELAEWVPPVQQLAAETEKTYVFFNNCHSDQAPRNAGMMAELLHVHLPRVGPDQPALFEA